MRHRMLEPIRQYGRERLEESGEAQRVRERHAEYYLALAEGADAQEAERELNAARPVAWLKRMESEHGNLRAALSWSLDMDDEPDGGRCCAAGVTAGGRAVVVLAHARLPERGAKVPGEGRLQDEQPYHDSLEGAGVRRRRLVGALSGGLRGVEGPDGGGAGPLPGASETRRASQPASPTSVWLRCWASGTTYPCRAVLEELGELKPELKNRNTLAYLLMLEGHDSDEPGAIWSIR